MISFADISSSTMIISTTEDDNHSEGSCSSASSSESAPASFKAPPTPLPTITAPPQGSQLQVDATPRAFNLERPNGLASSPAVSSLTLPSAKPSHARKSERPSFSPRACSEPTPSVSPVDVDQDQYPSSRNVEIVTEDASVISQVCLPGSPTHFHQHSFSYMRYVKFRPGPMNLAL